MSTEHVPAALSHLTAEEANFVYNVEVLGLPARKAASMAGMKPSRISAPHLVQAREALKRELRDAVAITKEDVVHGYQEAIHMAKQLAEPLTMIVGWEKTAKLLGYDQPQKIDININASVEVQQSLVKSMSDAELVKALGASNVIDGEFYEIGQEKIPAA